MCSIRLQKVKFYYKIIYSFFINDREHLYCNISFSKIPKLFFLSNMKQYELQISFYVSGTTYKTTMLSTINEIKFRKKKKLKKLQNYLIPDGFLI